LKAAKSQKIGKRNAQKSIYIGNADGRGRIKKHGDGLPDTF
jgi:hypothetical protein